MRVSVRHDGETHLADLDVEQEVRHGKLYADDELLYPPWTGAAYKKIGEIPELADALDRPDARFAAWIRARHAPLASLAMVGLVTLAGAAQITLNVASIANPVLAQRVSDAILYGATGYEPLLLDGAWWSPWTSQLLHSGGVHLVMNLPVLAYSGYRVERALGVGGLAVVATASVLGGTAAVTALGTLPVIGASILAYGLWGAQIAIGFRAGDAIPSGWKGFYGWGNLILFVPLFVAGLGAEGVSHLGHIGALIAGVVAASLVRAESFAPRAEVRSRTRANLLLAAALGAAPMVAAPALAHLPPAVGSPSERVEAQGAGASLELPWRMTDNPVRFGGLPAWLVSGNSKEPVFCGLGQLPAARDPSAADLAHGWSTSFGVVVDPADAPPPLGEGWSSYAWRVNGGLLVEHDLRRGQWLLRVGYHLPQGADGTGRQALYEHVLQTIQVDEPPALAEARREHGLYPEDPEKTWTFARELGRTGLGVEADAVWESLLARRDGWEREAARGRVEMWADFAEAGVDTLDAGTTLDERVAWLLARPMGAPDPALIDAGARWLKARGRCADAVTWLLPAVENPCAVLESCAPACP
jgi:rhomboid protease GluP